MMETAGGDTPCAVQVPVPSVSLARAPEEYCNGGDEGVASGYFVDGFLANLEPFVTICGTKEGDNEAQNVITAKRARGWRFY